MTSYPQSTHDGIDCDLSVTVVIVTFNSEATILECLAALNQQTFKPSRVIVVDNASTDRTFELMAKQFPENEYWRLADNLGFAAANNLAIKKCDTRFVALLNPDAYPEALWLAELVKAAEIMPDTASFGSRQVSATDANRLDGIGDEYHLSGLVWRRGHGRLQRTSDLISKDIFSACAGAALYRLNALRGVGGFDEDYFCYVEDVDLGFRLRLAGWSSRYIAQAVVRHVGGSSSGGGHSDFAIYHGHRNLVWTFFKDMPGPLFWGLLPIHIFMNLLSVVWFTARGHGRVIVQAKWDAIKGLPAQFRKRRQIQPLRRARIADLFAILNKGAFR